MPSAQRFVVINVCLNLAKLVGHRLEVDFVVRVRRAGKGKEPTDDAWLVGGAGLILRWNGSAWRPRSAPPVQFHAAQRDVDGDAQRDGEHRQPK